MGPTDDLDFGDNGEDTRRKSETRTEKGLSRGGKAGKGCQQVIFK